MGKIANNKIQTNPLDNNKIQAKKPEVGDVWARDYCQYYITRIQKFNDKIVAIHTLNINLVNTFYPLNCFLENFKYLGKSKVSIKELFDVRD